MLTGCNGKRPQALVVLLLVILFTLYSLYKPNALPSLKDWHRFTTPESERPAELPPFPKLGATGPGHACSTLAGAQDVLLVLKTGASEAQLKLPIHLNTTASCAPHFIAYSDLEEEINGYLVRDALDTIPDDVRQANPEFRFYDDMQQFKREGRQDYYKLIQSNADNPAKKLDKWKSLNLLDKAQETLPYAKWYLFMEADTAIIWWNLLPWLDTFDSNEPFYLGGQANAGDDEFARGGASYILSNRALVMAADALREDPRRFERVQEDCCGDLILAKVLRDLEIPLTHSQPTLQSETPSSLDYTSNNWCYPAVSYHHMSPHEINANWKFEQRWAFEQKSAARAPILHKDVFNHFIWPYIQHERRHWDNLSGDRILSADKEGMNAAERKAFTSLEACRTLCEAQTECVQYSYWEKAKTCKIGFAIRFGNGAHNGQTEIHSGWMPERIDTFRNDMEPCSQAWISPGG